MRDDKVMMRRGGGEGASEIHRSVYICKCLYILHV